MFDGLVEDELCCLDRLCVGDHPLGVYGVDA